MAWSSRPTSVLGHPRAPERLGLLVLPRRHPRAAHGALTGIDRGWAYAPGASVVDDVIQTLAT